MRLLEFLLWANFICVLLNLLMADANIANGFRWLALYNVACAIYSGWYVGWVWRDVYPPRTTGA